MPLDPRDEQNWLELSKHYPHLKKYSKDGQNRDAYATQKNNFLFDSEKKIWLKQSDGLISLKNVWLAAFEKFYKHENLGYISPSGWRKCITIAGISSALVTQGEAIFSLNTQNFPDYYKYLFNQSNASEAEIEQRKAFEKDPNNYVVDFDEIRGIDITVHIAIRSKDIAEEWGNLSDKHRQLLEECLWNALVNSFPELNVDDSSGQYSDLTDVFDYCNTHVRKIATKAELIRLISIDFNELQNILYPRPSTSVRVCDESLKRPYISSGRNVSPIEKQLATFLKSSGFLVILEPELYLPNPEAATYRNPDLLVIDKGRSLIVEIDDTSHLVDHDNGGRVNVNKWKRDRLLDRELLCSGIPVLRVWHEEARETPERVLSQILRVLESLGGSRLRYQ